MLYDQFAQPESDREEIAVLVRNPQARRVVVYTWNVHPDLVESARTHGAPGYLSKTLPARELGRRVGGSARRRGGHQPPAGAHPQRPGLDWPGRREGVTDRESGVLARITHGKSNAEVAALTHLSPITINSYIRAIYRKIGWAAGRRAHCGASGTDSLQTSNAWSVGATLVDQPAEASVARSSTSAARSGGLDS